MQMIVFVCVLASEWEREHSVDVFVIVPIFLQCRLHLLHVQVGASPLP